MIDNMLFIVILLGLALCALYMLGALKSLRARRISRLGVSHVKASASSRGFSHLLRFPLRQR